MIPVLSIELKAGTAAGDIGINVLGVVGTDAALDNLHGEIHVGVGYLLLGGDGRTIRRLLVYVHTTPDALLETTV